MVDAKKSNVLLLKKVMIPDITENWESGRLGCDERFAKRSDPINEDELNDALKKRRVFWEDK